MGINYIFFSYQLLVVFFFFSFIFLRNWIYRNWDFANLFHGASCFLFLSHSLKTSFLPVTLLEPPYLCPSQGSVACWQVWVRGGLEYRLSPWTLRDPDVSAPSRTVQSPLGTVCPAPEVEEGPFPGHQESQRMTQSRVGPRMGLQVSGRQILWAGLQEEVQVYLARSPRGGGVAWVQGMLACPIKDQWQNAHGTRIDFLGVQSLWSLFFFLLPFSYCFLLAKWGFTKMFRWSRLDTTL